MHILHVLPLIIVCIPVVWAVFWFVLLVGVTLFEKIHTQQYAPATTAGSNDSPYALAMNEAAKGLGLKNCGDFVQTRGGLYNARLTLWLSPNDDILVAVAGGTVAKLPQRRTSFYSHLGDGRFLRTMDEPGATDISGSTELNLVLYGNFKELHESHQERLRALSSNPAKFDASKVLQEYERIRGIQAERMEELGLIRFIDSERTIYRHTVKGAIENYKQGYRAQLAMSLVQKERAKLKRPGSV